MYLLISLMLTGVAAMAQPQLENTGFENWENLTSNTREPNEWNSIKTGGGNASTPNGFVVDRSTTVRPGTAGLYSALVETKNFLVVVVNVTVNGVVTNGRVEAPTFQAADGYIRTKTDDQNFYTSITDRPDSIVVWVNYQPSGNDQGSFEVILHDVVDNGLNAGQMGSLPESGNSQGNNTPQTIGHAGQNFTASTNGWTRVALPFTYNDSRTPQYILFTATSSGQGTAVVGSKMYIDDIALIYHIVGTPSAYSAYVNATNSYPLTVDFSTNGTPVASTDFVVEMSDANGSFANPTVIGTLNTSAAQGTINCVVPAGTPAGTGYLIRVTNASPYYRSIPETFEVINPTAAILPPAQQNLAINEAGTQLDLDATLAYLGVEWLWSTTPGGPYQSFNPAEVGMSYIPQFAAAGTYYVISNVNYGPWNLNTNEVVIVVSDVTSVNEAPVADIRTVVGNGSVRIDLTSKAKCSATYSITGSDGRMVSHGSLAAGMWNEVAAPQTAGLYTLQLTTELGTSVARFSVVD
jgi:hypothetical protein